MISYLENIVDFLKNNPIQCNWAENMEFSKRSEIEAMSYILSIYLQSWDKKAKSYPFELKEMLMNNKILESEYK